MRYGFVYKITLTDRANPPGRADEIREAVREWFRANGIDYGMGSLGGMKNVYGDVAATSREEIERVRERFTVFCSTIRVCALVRLGLTRSGEWSIMEEGWEREFEVDNLTDQDRDAAREWHAVGLSRLAQQVQKPANGN